MKLLTLSDLKHFWANAVQKIPIKISDLQDDVDMLTSHEDVHLEDLPNESPNIRFINNSPQITWNEHVYYDPATTLISGPSYEFDDETSLTSKSKIGYTNSSNSQNTVEHIYGQTYGTTKAFFTMKYYYGSNEKNAEEDESCTINSSLVFTLDPNYDSAGADTYYDESNAYSDVSPNNENYFIGRYRPFKEIRAKDFKFVYGGNDFSLISTIEEIAGSLEPHIADTDIHVTTSDKATWNTVTSKANDNAVVHLTGNETVGGNKIFTDNISLKSLTAEYTVTGASISVTYSDKNGLLLAQNKLGNYQSGISYNKFSIFAYDSNNQLIDRTLTYSSSSSTLATAYLRPDNDNIVSLGTSGNRWSKVYATNYYYGSDNTEFSTKFVTTDTNQTITGVKNFAVDVGILNTDTTANTPNLNLRNYKVDRVTTDTGVQTITFLDKNAKALTLIESRRISNGNTGTNILCYNTDENNNTVSGGVSIIKSKTDTNFAPTTDNAVTCGRPLAKWSGVYSTEYYYGANNTPFTDKFVTTDTNQTISSQKTFAVSPIIYNPDTSVNDYLVFKNPKVAVGSTTDTGSQRVVFQDKNGTAIGSLISSVDSNGWTYTTLEGSSLDSQSNVLTRSIRLRVTNSGGSLLPSNSTDILLGSASAKWSGVYATKYYYGSDGTEFSTKFVTTDTNQTITGKKTFDGTSVNFKSISGIYGASSGNASINFLDKNSMVTSYLRQGLYNSGLPYIKFDLYGKDADNQTIERSLTYSWLNNTSEAYFRPETNNFVYLGISNNRWKDVQTYKVNALEPSSLGMPDLDNGVDISSYITVNGGNKESLYTPTVNGWISVALTRTGGANMAVMLKQGNFASSGNNIAQENGTTTCNAMLPVKGGVQVSINSALADGIDFAYFYPCLGNV